MIDFGDEYTLVYFAHAKGGGPIKIGYTSDLKNRIKALGTWFVPGAEVITAFPGYRFREQFLHRALKPWQLQTEWYRSCLDVWRVIDEADSRQDISWLPEEPESREDWNPDTRDAAEQERRRLLNGLLSDLGRACLTPCAYIHGTVLHAELVFLKSLKDGALPSWLMDAHRSPARSAA